VQEWAVTPEGKKSQWIHLRAGKQVVYYYMTFFISPDMRLLRLITKGFHRKKGKKTKG
jgi:hypothetical protein